MNKETLTEKVREALFDYRYEYDLEMIANKIEPIISQSESKEQLEVVIMEGPVGFVNPFCIYFTDGKLAGVADGYDGVIEFCEKNNLKIKGEA